MRTSTLLLVVSLLVLPACGTAGSGVEGGGGDPDPSPLYVDFFAGDADATLGPVSLTFGLGGSPIDGRLGMEDVLGPAFEDAVAELEDLQLLLLFLVTPWSFGLPNTAIIADYAEQIEEPEEDSWIVALRGIVVDDPVGSLTYAVGTSIQIDTKNDLSWIQSPLPRTGRFGFLDLEAWLEVDRMFPGDGTAVFDVTLETTGDSPLEGEVLIKIDDNTAESLGTVTANTAERVTRRFVADPFSVRLTAEFNTTPAPKPGGLSVGFLFETRVQPRVMEVGSGLEGISSLDRGMWNGVNPDRPMTVGEFAVLISGGHHVELGLMVPGGYESADARPQPIHPADTTYRSSTIGVPMEYDGPGKTHPQTAPPLIAALVSVGSWGISIANYDNSAKAFENDDVVETGNMTDLAPFDGNPESGQAVYVDNSADAIKFIKRDALNQYVLDPSATLTNSAWSGASGRVVSAFRHASGDLLFVTDGEPGELWVLKPGQTTATRIGTAGTAPRNVRAAGQIAAVGAYGSALGFGSLTLFVRSSAGTWGYAPLSKTGPRSVGIDVKQLSDGRVAIAYPSYLNDLLNITVVDGTTGGIRKDEALELPEGCTNPGHCAFVRDDSVDAVLVSCNTSNNVVLLPVSYEETP